MATLRNCEVLLRMALSGVYCSLTSRTQFFLLILFLPHRLDVVFCFHMACPFFLPIPLFLSFAAMFSLPNHNNVPYFFVMSIPALYESLTTVAGRESIIYIQLVLRGQCSRCHQLSQNVRRPRGPGTLSNLFNLMCLFRQRAGGRSRVRRGESNLKMTWSRLAFLESSVVSVSSACPLGAPG